MAETCPASLAWPPQPQKWGQQATKKREANLDVKVDLNVEVVVVVGVVVSVFSSSCFMPFVIV